jgi:hypothetical protein
MIRTEYVTSMKASYYKQNLGGKPVREKEIREHKMLMGR